MKHGISRILCPLGTESHEKRQKCSVKFVKNDVFCYKRGSVSHHLIWYKKELTLNHLMSDILSHLVSLNIRSLIPGQDCKTLCNYLKGLSPAWQVLNLDWRLLQLQCITRQRWHNCSKPNTLKLAWFLYRKVCQRSQQPKQFASTHRSHKQKLPWFLSIIAKQIMNDRLSPRPIFVIIQLLNGCVECKLSVAIAKSWEKSIG